jgi:hypothetical protein
MNTILKWIAGIVATIAALTGALYSLQVWPFTPSDQPILISDSSVDITLDDVLNTPGDKHEHVIKDKKLDHIDHLDANGKSSAVACALPCTVVKFRLGGAAPDHEFDLRQAANGKDLILYIDIGWDSGEFNPAGTKFPKIPRGQLTDAGIRLANHTFKIYLK